MGNLVIQKFLSKQADIDTILKVIQRKVLKGAHLPSWDKGNQAGYLTSTSFQGHLLVFVTEYNTYFKFCN